MKKKSLFLFVLLSTVQLMWCLTEEEKDKKLNFLLGNVHIIDGNVYLYVRDPKIPEAGKLRHLKPDEIEIYLDFKRKSFEEQGRVYRDDLLKF